MAGEDVGDAIDGFDADQGDGVTITCTDWNPIRRDYDQRGILIATPEP